MRVAKFFKTYNNSSTIATYKSALVGYFDCIYGKDEIDKRLSLITDRKEKEALLKEWLEGQADRYFVEGRSYEEDVREFFVKIKDRPGMSVSQHLSIIKSFLVDNGVELKQQVLRELRRRKKGTRPVTIDKVPSSLELRRILSFMPINGKALFMMLASSGMRIGEALKLNVEDIELPSDPVKITIRGENSKTGNSRITFISSETKEVLEDWLRNRDKYIEGKKRQAVNGNGELKKRVFPFDVMTAETIWGIALKKAGLTRKDETTNRYQYHPHTLRKLFRTRMAMTVPVDVVEALMGHEGYLTQVYRRYTEDQVAEFYKKGEPQLSIFTKEEEITKLKKEVEDTNQQLQRSVTLLTLDKLEMEKKNEENGKKIKSLQADVSALRKLVETMIKLSSDDPWEERDAAEELKKFPGVFKGQAGLPKKTD